jgi:serine/threonine-protein kinase HipA
MSTISEVRLWGSVIGAVVLEDESDAAFFEYNSDFVGSGIEVAPLMMPLSEKVYTFPALARETFHGLPGLLSDSLPDRFGNALIDIWLAQQGRSPESLNAVERLCYTGTRGMGALEYYPVSGPEVHVKESIQVAKLVELASEVLSRRENLRGSFGNSGRIDALRDILQVGTSAGGARAKAVIAWNPETNEVCSGQVKAEKGFEYWLLKFDGVDGNRDKELADPIGYGAIEYAYYRMAIDAGINMSECRIFEENGRRHFMTRRFDRLPDGTKLHMQSLGALAHYDFNQAGAYGYEQALGAIRRLGLPMRSVEELFRRMVFNIVSRNQDDHVKNIAFLMDKSGRWALAPAFDMTYSFQSSGRWTSVHQMSLNGKRDGFVMQDFKDCAALFSMKQSLATKIVNEVISVVSRWFDYAEEAGVLPRYRNKIKNTHRLGFA